jgi:hypothetical protein
MYLYRETRVGMSPFLGTCRILVRQTALSVRMLALPNHPIKKSGPLTPMNTYAPVSQHPHVAAQVFSEKTAQ